MDPIKKGAKSSEGILGGATAIALYLAPLLGMTPEQIEILKQFSGEIIIVVVSYMGLRTAYKMWRDWQASKVAIAATGAPPGLPSTPNTPPVQ